MARSHSRPPVRSRPAWSADGAGSAGTRPSSPPETRSAPLPGSAPAAAPALSLSRSSLSPFHHPPGLPLAARDGLRRDAGDLRIEPQVAAQPLALQRLDPTPRRRLDRSVPDHGQLTLTRRTS